CDSVALSNFLMRCLQPRCFTLQRNYWFLVMVGLHSFTVVFAQQGDLKDPPGVVQRPPPAHWVIPEAPVLNAQEAIGSFQLAPGFRIELVASEPLIRDPVALDFDADGRLWVVEMQ